MTMKADRLKPSWHELSEHAWKTDLGPDKPELLLLRVSKEEFEKLHANEKAAREYLDRFLKKPLNNLSFSHVQAAQANGGEWYLIVVHTPSSTGRVVAWQTS